MSPQQQQYPRYSGYFQNPQPLSINLNLPQQMYVPPIRSYPYYRGKFSPPLKKVKKST